MKNLLFILLIFTCVSTFCQDQKKEETIPIMTKESPIYEGCEIYKTNAERKNCMETMLATLVEENFDHELINCLKVKTVYNRKKKTRTRKCIQILIPGEKRIFVDFTISEEGNIKDIVARAPHQKLKDEAIRVAQLIPKIIPTKHNGKPIKTSYSIPIDLVAK